jgi:hypothetical protein
MQVLIYVRACMVPKRPLASQSVNQLVNQQWPSRNQKQSRVTTGAPWANIIVAAIFTQSFMLRDHSCSRLWRNNQRRLSDSIDYIFDLFEIGLETYGAHEATAGLELEAKEKAKKLWQIRLKMLRNTI